MQQGVALIYDAPIVVEPLDTLYLVFYSDRFYKRFLQNKMNHGKEALSF